MKKVIRCAAILAGIASSSLAQNTRSAVSVAGIDTAACTIADPCRTFIAAMQKTNPGGEIIAVTSGGYGPFVVDRAVTVAGAPGVTASIFGALNGIGGLTINAGPTDRVVIRGLIFNGGRAAYTYQGGINIFSATGETSIENCIISNYAQWGIHARANVTIIDTWIHSCDGGVSIDNVPTPIHANLERVTVRDVQMNSGFFFRQATATVRDSASLQSGEGFSVVSSVVTVDNSIASGAPYSGFSTASGAILRLSRCLLTNNTRGLSIGSGTTVELFGDNIIRGNTFDIQGPTTTVSKN